VHEYIRRRVLEVSAYLIETSATVRQAAGVFGVSKSTVHKDMTERLPRINQQLARKVRHVLDINKAERHLRGGEATRRRYQGGDVGKI
jgi:putative DeoR family transcriptional regulator (stage III sporulation protein D)